MKREHQLPAQFRSFKEKSDEGHQKYKPRVDWTYLNTNQRKPLNQVRYLQVQEV